MEKRNTCLELINDSVLGLHDLAALLVVDDPLVLHTVRETNLDEFLADLLGELLVGDALSRNGVEENDL